MRRAPSLIWADSKGQVLDHPRLEMAGMSGHTLLRPLPKELSPLPEGSKLFFLPRERPVGWDPAQEAFSPWEGLAVAAFPAPGHTRTLLPATRMEGAHPPLPLWAYTAAGWKGGRIWMAAVRVDASSKQDPDQYDDRDLLARVEARLKAEPKNRLLSHVAHCATHYHCLAAKNLFYHRWEAPLPTAPACNADCVGCLSFQPDGDFSASHHRIAFIPEVEEVAALAVPHLEGAEDAIVSFGQGCEGDPLLQAPLLEASIRRTRSKTGRGTIHLNTNGSLPQAVLTLARAGLESIRISLNSAREEVYAPYYRPKSYSFSDVAETARMAVAEGLFVSLNLLVFPGVTDREEEVEALEGLIEETGLHMVQLKNLCIDPGLYLKTVPPPRGEAIGVISFIGRLRERFPGLDLGYFNRPKSEFPFARPRGGGNKP